MQQSGVLNAQSHWSKRYDLQSGNDYGTQIIAVDTQLVIKVKALCEFNTRQCEGIMIISESGIMRHEIVYYDTLATNYVECIFRRGDTLFMNMNYRQVLGRQFGISKQDILGNSYGIVDYFYPATGKTSARGIAGNDSTIFVSFTYVDSLSGRERDGIYAFDLSWNLIWQTSVPNTAPNASWCDIAPASDGGLIALYAANGGSAISNIATIEKYSVSGELEWQTVLPHVGEHLSEWVRIDNHPDGGIVGMWHLDTFGLNISEVPTLIFKVDADGVILWERLELSEQLTINDLFITQNGDVVACGIAEDLFWDDTDGDYRVAYVLRLNSDGEFIWDRRIAENDIEVYSYDLYSGTEMYNGDLVFTGEISDDMFGTPEDPTPGNVWVVKLDSMGCLNPECGEWQDIITQIRRLPAKEEEPFVMFPNPSSDNLFIGAQLGAQIKAGDYDIVFYDMNGKVERKEELDPYRLSQYNLSALPRGSYLILIYRENQLLQSFNLQLQ